MDKSTLKVLMCEVPHFDKLNSDELDIIAKHVQYRKMSVGTTLLEEGTLGGALYYVVEGLIEIKKEGMDGSQTVLAHFRKGAAIGEMSLIEENCKHSATAIVIKDSKFLVLTRKNFNKMIDNFPRLAIKILLNITCSISSRLRHTSGRFADIFKS